MSQCGFPHSHFSPKHPCRILVLNFKGISIQCAAIISNCRGLKSHVLIAHAFSSIFAQVHASSPPETVPTTAQSCRFFCWIALVDLSYHSGTTVLTFRSPLFQYWAPSPGGLNPRIPLRHWPSLTNLLGVGYVWGSRCTQ